VLDAPLAVAARTRAELENLILRQRPGMTTLPVTHDIDEAVHVGKRMIVPSSSLTMALEDLKIDLSAMRDRIGTRSPRGFAGLRGHGCARIQRAKGAR
jgi:NitT/TauT family transport system ATP-binding protein